MGRQHVVVQDVRACDLRAGDVIDVANYRYRSTPAWQTVFAVAVHDDHVELTCGRVGDTYRRSTAQHELLRTQVLVDVAQGSASHEDEEDARGV